MIFLKNKKNPEKYEKEISEIYINIDKNIKKIVTSYIKTNKKHDTFIYKHIPNDNNYNYKFKINDNWGRGFIPCSCSVGFF